MEEWRDISGFRGYQVSNKGRVRTNWYKQRCRTGYGTYCEWRDDPRFLPQSDDGNGYLKVFIRNHDTGKSYCKKVHRLVAEAFIPCDDLSATVDHIKSGPEGKLNNSVENLQWMSRSDNIRKAYRDGMCDERIRSQRKPIVATDIFTDEQAYFSSIQEASNILDIERTSISHVLIGDSERTGHYYFEYAGREERLLYGNEAKMLSWIRMGVR